MLWLLLPLKGMPYSLFCIVVEKKHNITSIHQETGFKSLDGQMCMIRIMSFALEKKEFCLLLWMTVRNPLLLRFHIKRETLQNKQLKFTAEMDKQNNWRHLSRVHPRFRLMSAEIEVSPQATPTENKLWRIEDRWMNDKNVSLFCQKGHHISHTFIFLQPPLKWSQEIFFKLKIFHHNQPFIRIYLKTKKNAHVVSSQLHLQPM